jgi:hypothetical protein
MARRTRPGAQTVQTQVPETDLTQAVTPTGITGAPSRPGAQPGPASVEQAAGEAQAQAAIDAASQQANPLVQPSDLLNTGGSPFGTGFNLYGAALPADTAANAAAAQNITPPVAPIAVPTTDVQKAAEAYRNLPVTADPMERASVMNDYRQALNAQKMGPSVDHYNKWLIDQGINPTTIGGAKLVAGPQGERMMDIPSINQQTQAAQTLGQVHARHADLMRAAQMESRRNPTLSAQLKDAARNIFPQTSSYENNLRGYLDLIRPDVLKSTAGLEQYLPTGYRPVMSPEDIAQQYAGAIKNVRKAPKQKRGQEEEEET